MLAKGLNYSDENFSSWTAAVWRFCTKAQLSSIQIENKSHRGSL